MALMPSLAAAIVFAAPAPPPPARVERVEGQIALKQAGAKGFSLDPKALGRRIDPGDQLKTLEKSRAHVSYPLGTVGLMAPETVFGLDQAGLQPRASVLAGEALFALTRPFDRGWSFSVRSPSAVATTERGAFTVEVRPDRSSKFRVVSGTLRVRARGRTVRAGPGQEVIVLYDRVPSDPRPAPAPLVSTNTFAISGSLFGAEPLLP